ncbi:hypothetical protein PHYPSEUDO_001975 [Phytophthora pseudosyringae]|uniref:Transmembrane protein n=1 Tax=Phytophthora pseudosyringae TaxID=221518 RepID=A0A8T1VYI0_9STRA|nr:hypothetical protein PHYPSEUDO_001975 [Phytophthora pseudosyringae]
MLGLVRVLKDKAPVLVFSGLCAGASYAVYYAHHQQIAEKKVRVIPLHSSGGAMPFLERALMFMNCSLLQVMRQGVINDIKRDRIKRREMQQQEHHQQ